MYSVLHDPPAGLVKRIEGDEIRTAGELGEQENEMAAETTQADDGAAFHNPIGVGEYLAEGIDHILVDVGAIDVGDGQHRPDWLCLQGGLDGLALFFQPVLTGSQVREISNEDAFVLICDPM